jgi:hypothetical protein
MSERRFHAYAEPVAALQFNEKRVIGSPVDSELVNAVVDDYSRCRRNNLCLYYNSPSVMTVTARQRSKRERICPDIPLTGRVRGDTLRIQMRVAASAEDKLYLTAEIIGAQSDDYFVEVEALGAEAWHTLDIDITSLGNSNGLFLRLSVYSKNYDSTTLTVYGVSGYCIGDSAAPVYTDLTGANTKVGTDDYPDSAFCRKLLRDNAVAVHENRVVGNNIINHWLRQWYSLGGYGVNNDQLGRYKVIKREGITSVMLFVCYETALAGPTFTLRGALGANVQTVAGLASAGATAWAQLTFSGLPDAETEYELLIDASEPTAANGFYAPYVMMTGLPVTTAMNHTVPDVVLAGTGKMVLSSEWNNMRDSIDNLWRINTDTMLCDWRFSIFGYSWDNRFKSDATAFDKDDFGPDVATGFGGSVVARTLVFASPKSKVLQIDIAYRVYNDVHHEKAIHIQLGHSMVETTWDDVDPKVDQDHGTLIVGGTGQYDGEEVLYYSTILDIPTAAWNSPYDDITDPAVPYQVWISMCTTDASEYLEPLMVCITEKNLNRMEFP